MKETTIWCSHHFYLTILIPGPHQSVNSWIRDLESKAEEVVKVGTDSKLSRIQVHFKKRFGAKEVMESNIDKKSGFYCYDLYIGEVSLSKKNVIFICCPYKGLENHIKKNVEAFNEIEGFLLPSVEKVLNYMKKRYLDPEKDFSPGLMESDQSFSVDVKRYSATTAKDKVQLSGSNPLTSEIFQILYREKIKLNTTSLKLGTKKLSDETNDLSGSLEVLFDYYGNIRFWIPKVINVADLQPYLSMINPVLNYFEEIRGYLDEEDSEEKSDKEDLEV